MTNATIIFTESFKLMKQGVLEGTGELVTIDINGTPTEVELPEEIHTYQKWKELGYQVQKGQKAITQFPIWKYTAKKKKEDSEEKAQEEGHCFLKKASFFKKSQVEKIEEVKK